MPRRTAVYVAAGGAQTVLFRCTADPRPAWLVAKLSANGRVVYERVKYEALE